MYLSWENLLIRESFFHSKHFHLYHSRLSLSQVKRYFHLPFSIFYPFPDFQSTVRIISLCCNSFRRFIPSYRLTFLPHPLTILFILLHTSKFSKFEIRLLFVFVAPQLVAITFSVCKFEYRVWSYYSLYLRLLRVISFLCLLSPFCLLLPVLLLYINSPVLI